MIDSICSCVNPRARNSWYKSEDGAATAGADDVGGRGGDGWRAEPDDGAAVEDGGWFPMRES